MNQQPKERALPTGHTATIECPSGLTVTMARMTAADLSELSKASRREFLQRLCDVLTRCTKSIEAPGPYGAAVGPLDGWHWMDALTGDRQAAQLRHRVLSLGAAGREYRFEVICPLCGTARWHAVDLLTDVGYVPYEPEVLAVFRDGGEFTLDLPGGGRVGFRLGTGRTDALTLGARKTSDREALAQSMLPRLGAVEGLHANDRARFLSDLELEDLDALTEAMDAVQGGVDTLVTIQCGTCRASQQIHLPFSEAAFYLPSMTRKTSGEARRASIRRLTGGSPSDSR